MLGRCSRHSTYTLTERDLLAALKCERPDNTAVEIQGYSQHDRNAVCARTVSLSRRLAFRLPVAFWDLFGFCFLFSRQVNIIIIIAKQGSTTVVCKQPLDAKKPNMLPRQGGSPCLLHVQELACLGSAGLASPIEQAGSTTRLAHTDKSTIPAIGNDHSWTMRSRRRCATSLYRYR